MPVKSCSEKGKPGYKFGDSGKCYTYSPGNEASRKKAKQKAHIQGAAIGESIMENFSNNNEQERVEMADKPKVLMHKVNTKDVVEDFSDSFNDVKEGSIDEANLKINGVCLFGRRESDNNRVYTDKALSSLTKLADGAKCYINHISKSELKDRGVRDLRDWCGVFENSRRSGDAVHANLRVRESYFDLVKDIALLGPSGIGHSIDARVKVYQDNDGKESVADIDSLRSVDLVSQGATISNLWESLQIKMEDTIDPNIEILKDLAEQKVKEITAEEGVIQDKLNNDKIKNELSDITYTANRLIEDTIYDDKLSITDKKNKVISIFSDLDSEVKKKLKGIKENLITEDEMEDKERQDVKTQAIEEYKKSEAVQKMGTDLTEAKDKVKELGTNLEETTKVKDTEIRDLKESIEDLRKQNKELSRELDDRKLSEKAAERDSMINRIIAEVKLPKDAVNDIFVSDLKTLEEKKDGDKIITVEEQVQARVEDRRAIWFKDSGKVTGAGDEFDAEKDAKESKEVKEVTEKDVDGFVSSCK